jgi:putative ABC transport system permease protein
VLGTDRKTLIRQFLADQLTAVISLAISLLIAWFVLPYLTISGKSLSLSQLFNSSFLPFLLLLPLIVGLLAGSYPAFLSSFQPVSVLKGKISTGQKEACARLARCLSIRHFNIPDHWNCCFFQAA